MESPLNRHFAIILSHSILDGATKAKLRLVCKNLQREVRDCGPIPGQDASNEFHLGCNMEYVRCTCDCNLYKLIFPIPNFVEIRDQDVADHRWTPTYSPFISITELLLWTFVASDKSGLCLSLEPRFESLVGSFTQQHSGCSMLLVHLTASFAHKISAFLAYSLRLELLFFQTANALPILKACPMLSELCCNSAQLDVTDLIPYTQARLPPCVALLYPDGVAPDCVKNSSLCLIVNPPTSCHCGGTFVDHRQTCLADLSFACADSKAFCVEGGRRSSPKCRPAGSVQADKVRAGIRRNCASLTGPLR
jgi:hypothetical protein